MKKLIFNVVLVLVATNIFAQVPSKKAKVEPIYSIFQKSDMQKSQREDSLGKTKENCAPELPKVKSDDVIFAKRITRDIYFADPANRYMVPADMGKNLIDVLMNGVQNDKTTAYQKWDKNTGTLVEPIPLDSNSFTAFIDTKVGSFSPRQYGDLEITSKLGLRIIEDWYFDTNRSEFKSFIITMSIIYPGANILTPLTNENKNLADKQIKLGEVGADMSSLFYLNYPTIREYLCKFTVFHPNTKIRYTFDDIFQLRYFSSVIVEESNADGNTLATRPDLKSGLDKLLEADRIKKSLVQYEQDMWQH